MKGLFISILTLSFIHLNAQTEVHSYDPVWSPNGEQILFYSNLDGDYEIYVMNKDGKNLIQLTDNDVPDGEPSWSPDGSQILYTSRRNGLKGVYLQDLKTSKVSKLLEVESSITAPLLSPNGLLIAFESKMDGHKDIFVMTSSGKNVMNLTGNEANDLRPYWAPDGKYLYFQSKRSGKYRIYRMDVDGSNVTCMLESDTHHTNPTLMHHQNKMLFTNHTDTSVNIEILDLQEGTIERVTTDLADVMFPSFSPDDSNIVFAQIVDGRSQIFVMEYASKKITQLTKF